MKRLWMIAVVAALSAAAWAQPGVPDDKDDAPFFFLDVLNHEFDLTLN